jgi:hypothetical protein
MPSERRKKILFAAKDMRRDERTKERHVEAGVMACLERLTSTTEAARESVQRGKLRDVRDHMLTIRALTLDIDAWIAQR